jgi:hypothetical protein
MGWTRVAVLTAAALSGLAMTVAPIAAPSASAGSSTFYLNSKPGCYSFTSPTEENYAIENTRYKLLFRGSCAEDHHIQVIYSGVIKVAGGASASEQQVYKACAAYYKKKIGSNPPTTIQNKKPYLRYWWPDAGLETLKYSNKIVCYLHQADARYERYALMVGGF